MNHQRIEELHRKSEEPQPKRFSVLRRAGPHYLTFGEDMQAHRSRMKWIRLLVVLFALCVAAGALYESLRTRTPAKPAEAPPQPSSSQHEPIPVHVDPATGGLRGEI